MAHDFWQHSGYSRLNFPAAGWPQASEALIQAYLARPELRPLPESCPAERALHDRLYRDSRYRPTPLELAELHDPSVRENYELVMRFRDHVFASEDLRVAYLDLVRRGHPPLPLLFRQHLVMLLLRHLLADCTDAWTLRAAEMLFRAQLPWEPEPEPAAEVEAEAGAVEVEAEAGSRGAPRLLLADHAVLTDVETHGGYGNLGRLVADSGVPLNRRPLWILEEETAQSYWLRDSFHDSLLPFGPRTGQQALAEVLARWIQAMVGETVTLIPLAGDPVALWSRPWRQRLPLDEAALELTLPLCPLPGMARPVALFRLDWAAGGSRADAPIEESLCVVLAADGEGIIRLEPASLCLSLPRLRDEKQHEDRVTRG